MQSSEKAFIVDIISEEKKEIRTTGELVSLLSSLDIETLKAYVFSLKRINPKTSVSAGHLNAIKEEISKTEQDGHKVSKIVFNFELSPLQEKNLEEFFKKDVRTRTEIIIEVFKRNANSKEALLQVEIAELDYLKTRLVLKDANYEQMTSGGYTNTRGAGEKQIDLNRRTIKRRLLLKERQLEDIKNARKVMRNKRNQNIYPKVAIVGYTNAGKSTLMNRLIALSKNKESKYVLAENRLFATLETSTRLIEISDYPSFFLTDTVGFISNLPTTLVKAFRSTLEEIKEADFIVHVVDLSDEDFKEAMKTTNDTLKAIGVENIEDRMIYVYNKVDRADFAPEIDYSSEIIVSLLADNDVYKVLNLLISNFKKRFIKKSFVVSYSFPLYELKKFLIIEEEKEVEDGYFISGYISPYGRRFLKD